jgi:hypothetical protein
MIMTTSSPWREVYIETINNGEMDELGQIRDHGVYKV